MEELKSKLLEILNKEEIKEGVKIGYQVSCFRNEDWYWKCDFGDNSQDGMVTTLIEEGTLNFEQIEKLIKER